jgi:hypothetical protein
VNMESELLVRLAEVQDTLNKLEQQFETRWAVYCHLDGASAASPNKNRLLHKLKH